MEKMTFETMQEMQRELQEKYKGRWAELSPEKARQQLLWMYGEMGEVGDIMKKKGNEEIMHNDEVRAHFIEEMCDVMMYFNDVLLCYDIKPEELEKIYLEKHRRNMGRW
ncbi:MAG TPA: nucleotide pyrophosphohydrolase [Candidatus Eisenbergiella merdavium]|uniref:Nucleotide pyrophosphohydrolase n=1 Tax=Candidatus Eisenbergiella merdavium TaxID=2838551 RepID=A0A9D2NJZ3_9FIRM|nr:nucleotide pyrophosphohydrolase [Candidatus Eisenbergiella merdavium]